MSLWVQYNSQIETDVTKGDTLYGESHTAVISSRCGVRRNGKPVEMLIQQGIRGLSLTTVTRVENGDPNRKKRAPFSFYITQATSVRQILT